MSLKLKFLLISSLVLSNNFKADYKKAKEVSEAASKSWSKSIKEQMTKSKGLDIEDLQEGAGQVVVKVEDLYQEVFGSQISWPNAQRRCGQFCALALRLGLTFLLVGLAKNFCIDRLGLEAKENQRRFIKMLAALGSYKLSNFVISKLSEFISWDPRCVAFANKILECIDSGKTLVSDQPAVQNVADNALAASGRSTCLVKLGQRMTHEQKIQMAEDLRKAIERV